SHRAKSFVVLHARESVVKIGFPVPIGSRLGVVAKPLFALLERLIRFLGRGDVRDRSNKIDTARSVVYGAHGNMNMFDSSAIDSRPHSHFCLVTGVRLPLEREQDLLDEHGAEPSQADLQQSEKLSH